MTKTLILILTLTNLSTIYAQDKNYSPVPKKENPLHRAIKTAINGMSKMIGFGEIESCPIPEFLKPTPPPEPPEKKLTPEEIKRINNLLLSHFRKPMEGTKDKIAIRAGLLATYKYAIKQSKKARADPKSGPKFADLNILRDIRVEYNQMLQEEINKIQIAIDNGHSREKVARMVWQARISVGKRQKAKTPRFYRKLIYKRNKRIYGEENEFGPDFEKLERMHRTKIKKVKGKDYDPSDNEIYDSIIKAGPATTNVF